MELIGPLKKLERIAEGWNNVVFKSPTVEKLAKIRAKICSTCPHAVESSWLQNIGDSLQEIKGLKCDLCNCPLSAATRSITKSCPDTPSKW